MTATDRMLAEIAGGCGCAAARGDVRLLPGSGARERNGV
jgi:hypothetical protein